MHRSAIAVGAVLAAAGLWVGVAPAQERDTIGEVLGRLFPDAAPPQEEPPPFGEPYQPEPDPVFRVDIQPLDENEEADPEAPPASRTRFPIATIQVVNKLTAESARFDMGLESPVQYEALIFTLRACEGSAPDEPVRDFAAHLQVDFRSPTPGGRSSTQTIYRGWMYASSPSIAPLQNSVYDAWLISCKAAAPTGG